MSNGIGYVPAYQLSGIPYVTSSGGLECDSGTLNVVRIKFPRVTRWVMIAVSGSSAAAGGLRVGFTENGVKGLGAITGSLYTGVIDQWDAQVWATTTPKPTAAELLNTHKNYFVMAPTQGGTTPAVGVGVIGTSTPRLEMMCTDLYLRADGAGNCGFTVIAGLTNIHRDNLLLTGSAGYWGVG
jgi:hypothetical protein